jgi:antirestriction protein ArdC
MKRTYKPKETIHSLSRKVQSAVEATLNSERFKEYLATMARFHKYSFHNQMLITLQRPDATRVAGFRTWQEQFNRHVKRGAKSIAIFGHPRIITREEVLDDGTVEITERTWWPIVHVFDISDTEGEPLPELDQRRIRDDSPQATRVLKQLVEVVKRRGIDYQEVDRVAGAFSNPNTYGAYSPSSNRIELVATRDISRGELFKTLSHEFGHALYEDLFTRTHEGHTYAYEECVVETSAMIVASRFGLSLAPYDVSYVASWSRGDRTLYQEGLERATILATHIINQMEDKRKES